MPKHRKPRARPGPAPASASALEAPSRSSAGSPPEPAGLRATDVAAGCVVLVATLAVHGSILGHGFLNWDDPDALVENPALDHPGVAAWAFTTTHMSHYQPLAWLFWAGLRRALGTSAAVHHLASLVLHALNALLVLLVARRMLSDQAAWGGRAVRLAAAVAALAFALHPLRVEPVAWASALPYPLALCLLLLSVLAYWTNAGSERTRVTWLAAALLAYTLSLLARPIALGFPLVLLAVDRCLGRPWRRSLVESLPFALLSLGAGLLEGQARAFVGLERIGLGPRLSAAVAAPFVYLGRALAPIGLSPLDVLPLEPRTSWTALIGGALGLIGCAVLAWRAWPRRRWLVAGALSYLALLAPALGLLPSGVQATADRYSYLAHVPLALLAGAWLAAGLARRGARLLVPVVVALGVLGALAWQQAGWWRDSVTLWGRAVALDPRNDVALYNLALALEEAGDEEAARLRLRETLRLVPDHEPAHRQLSRLEARGFERDGGRAAAAGRPAQAVALFTSALEREPERMRSLASRGMALLELGRVAEAASDLAAARRLGNDEVEVAGALGFCLTRLGREAEAALVLEQALLSHPANPGLARELERLRGGTAARPPR